MADPYFDQVLLQIVGAWPNGATIMDSSGHFMPLEAIGNAQLNSTHPSPVSGASAHFDGDGDIIRLPKSQRLTFSGDFAIELWFRTSQTGRQYATLLSAESRSGGYTILLNNAGHSAGDIAVYSGADGMVSYASGNYADGAWHYVKWCRVGSSLMLVVDTMLKSVTTNTGTHVCDGDVVFGNNVLYSGRDYLGDIDGVRFSGVGRYDLGSMTPPIGEDYSYAPIPGVSCVVVPHFYSSQNTGSQQFGSPLSALKPVSALRRDIYFGGAGRVAGVTTVNGVPASKRVWLQEKASKLVIAQTWSAANGTYEFNNVDPEREYVVFSDDHTHAYNAVVSDRVVPV